VVPVACLRPGSCEDAGRLREAAAAVRAVAARVRQPQMGAPDIQVKVFNGGHVTQADAVWIMAWAVHATQTAACGDPRKQADSRGPMRSLVEPHGACVA